MSQGEQQFSAFYSHRRNRGGAAPWVLLVLGLPFVLKGSLMIFRPSVLGHEAIAHRPTGRKVKSALRSLIGAALTAWGIILL